MPKTDRDQTYSIQHCIQRFRERYNLTVTEAEHNELNRQVREFMKTNKQKGAENDFALIYDIEHFKTIGATTFVLKIKNFKNVTIFCNYEDKRDYVTTILPPIVKRK